MLKIVFIPYENFSLVRQSALAVCDKLRLIADMSRLNTLSAVKKAGSGHLGSSMSAMDIVTALYFHEMNVLSAGIDSPGRDIYFSSKGHDCPGYYALLTAAGILPLEKLLLLRRLDGLDGHPDVRIPGVEANSGSLGMGVSKGKGIALGKTMRGDKGMVYVLTGDGELQEGQFWESLQTTAHQGISNITVIIDYNKIQSDKPIEKIIALGDLQRKIESFGWYATHCDGHDYNQITASLAHCRNITGQPKCIIADTIKGKGISFMEGPQALQTGNGLYKWHSGAPDDESYEAGCQELIGKINSQLKQAALPELSLEVFETRPKNRVRLKDTAEKVVSAYGSALVTIGSEHPELLVLDADLSADCGLRPFEQTFPERFIENGIAEQDMVSMAGGLALQGFLPVVNSFGVFLASRANEQIYANACEGTKIIYACHYAGLLPAGPGKSHQSLRDISLFGALPNCTIVEPSNGWETEKLFRWLVESGQGVCMIRLIISPSPRNIVLPETYAVAKGNGCVLKDGTDTAIVAYGPVMLNEALIAADLLESRTCSCAVINMPWLNCPDKTWAENELGRFGTVFVLDNHAPYGGLGDALIKTYMESDILRGKKIFSYAIQGQPACGTPQEALRFHRMDGESICEKIVSQLCLPCPSA
ncbi:MAG: transketolase C-terminal domain-containing protein [Candidatus Auribacterota bacterium]|jgi:transketolase|nr:transketolase C-terminal domain-containing protein [Candidatus Auribacterota bacterium]